MPWKARGGGRLLSDATCRHPVLPRPVRPRRPAVRRDAPGPDPPVV